MVYHERSKTNFLRVPSVISVVIVLTFAGPWISPVENARILAVEPVGCKSHWYFMSAVLRSLTDAGHHVTVFTPFPDGDRENYTKVDMSDRNMLIVEQDLVETMTKFSPPIPMTNELTTYSRIFCDSVHENERLGEIIRSGADGRWNFDVIVMESFGPIDCMSSLANALNLPIIYVIPSPMLTFAERSFTGHVSNPACVSHIFADHAVPKTFVQRFTNVAVLAYSVLKVQYDVWILQSTDPKPYDSSPTVRPSLIFQNSHYITESSRPVPPNLIDVGGIHLKPPKNLPKDILDFIEDSPNGVIYFTFGSMVKLSSLPKHIENTFKKVFSNVPQRVLWKYENEINDMPKNVMVKKWFPQREILLHPKVKLFISHGGMSGVYEALDAGVPVLGFPLIYDQPRNLKHLVHAGMAITMDVLNVSEDILYNAISELINNENYLKNAKIASNIFKDRPMTPAQSVVYWTEYVIRHRGAPHLKSHALNLTWYQYFLLDVIGTLIIIIFMLLFITYKVVKNIYSYIFEIYKSYKVKTQ